MSQKTQAKPLSAKAIEAMKSHCNVRTDTGLRVSCGATGIKTFINRYSSPVTYKLVPIKIGNFPQISLSEARVKLQELKQLRQLGRCPATELKEEKQYKKQEQLQPQETKLTVKALIELYLVERIEDRKGKDGKIIAGARKKKGHSFFHLAPQ
ncbi:Arm DNA-binding domain-containing protein [Moellerella wisconsensis]|uniref:Arm DNA-binding domain-containing protein n=1 Tax=Moellerella wisconsensis TaxID=158849 RepID=UPI001F4EE20A|nr:Arm DNA-binding domain-containing protein [Moellerella wisconsensis]UNH27863.1 Arm DNA-binding domain-containing protein [Moellerella wisconsensis]